VGGSKSGQSVTLQACIPEVRDANLCAVTDSPGSYLPLFCHSFQANAEIVPEIRPRL
jgi:hypothetical protein